MEKRIVNSLDTKSRLGEKCRFLIEKIGEGVCFVNRNMVLTFANDKFCEISGWSRNALLGKKLLGLLGSESKKKLIRELEKRTKSESWRYQLKLKRRGGEEVSVSLYGSPVFESGGEFDGYVAVMSVISERKELDEESEKHAVELEREVEKRTELLVNLYKGLAIAEERNRLAREIHNGLVQTLASSASKIDLCERLLEESPEKIKKELSELRRMITKCVRETRRLIFGLRLPRFHRTGFTTVLKQYFDEFGRKTGIKYGLSINLHRSIPVKTQVGIYKIIREAVNNVRKHARANHIDVALRTDRRQNLYLTIRDDGIGFDLEKAFTQNKSARHFGLKGMKEQAEILGGNFAIESGEGFGTEIKVRVPLKEGSLENLLLENRRRQVG